jgi:HSP20 family protein
MVNLTPWGNRRRDVGGTGAITNYRSGIDRLFENLLSGFESAHQSSSWFPALELSDGDNEIVVKAEVPGMEPDDIEVTVAGNQLVISGEKRDENEEQHEGYRRSERQYGYFRRVIDLPQDIDPQRIDARYNNGLLELHIPKTEESQPRRISVQNVANQPRRESGSRGSRGGSGLNLRESPESAAPRAGNRGMSPSGTTRTATNQLGNAQRDPG